jgi:hypothetical protein
MRVCAKSLGIAVIGILIILYALRRPSVEGFQNPANVPLPVLQGMFWQAGCRRVLREGDVWWWRKQPNMNIIQNDMNAYASLTRTCSGVEWQHEFCDPGKCGCGWK